MLSTCCFTLNMQFSIKKEETKGTRLIMMDMQLWHNDTEKTKGTQEQNAALLHRIAISQFKPLSAIGTFSQRVQFFVKSSVETKRHDVFLANNGKSLTIAKNQGDTKPNH
jgi:hypothetical protein